MRDPDLVQRAERASIVLEQAWERWREMHGLGAEPLPPVSSYVGYSLEEPLGQPRVVFGLRADEAELLAAQLDGHDCVGPLYAEVGARAEWRRTVHGPASLPRPAYGDPFSVPAQARPAEADLMEPETSTDYADRPWAERAPRDTAMTDSAAVRRLAARKAGLEGQPLTGADASGLADADWPGAGSESPGHGEVRASEAGMANSPPLAPLPPVIDLRPRSDQSPAELAELDAPVAPPPGPGRPPVPTQGPGYRGPRYRGFPPRYQAGGERAGAGRDAAPVPEGDADGEPEPEPATDAPQQVARLTRPPRKRTKSVRHAEKADPPGEQSAADQAR